MNYYIYVYSFKIVLPHENPILFANIETGRDRRRECLEIYIQ